MVSVKERKNGGTTKQCEGERIILMRESVLF